MSKNRERFLREFFSSRSIEEILTNYILANGVSKKLADSLPIQLVESVRQSLLALESLTGPPIRSTDPQITIETVSRCLKKLNGGDFVRSFLDSRFYYSKPTDDSVIGILTNAEFWLNELVGCISGQRGIFSDRFNVEDYFDRFVEFAGGNRLTDIVGPSPNSDNADYFFKDDNVLLELKILEEDFVESNRAKLQAARAKALETVQITPAMILGKDVRTPPEVILAENLVIRTALQRITKKANAQHKNSRMLLNAPSAASVTVFLIDGFYSVNPFLVLELLHDPLTRQFSGTDAIVLVNLRRKITMNLGDGPFDYFIWQPRYRMGFPDFLPSFVNMLGETWAEYMQVLSGVRFNKHILSHDSRNLSKGSWQRSGDLMRNNWTKGD